MIPTIAIDDEPLALQLVESYIRKTPFLAFSGSFDNPLAAMEYMAIHPVQLVFLDIQMPDLSGTEFARNIGTQAKIVFTTAFEKYALEGYRLDVVDYLLKPFGYDNFLVAAQKAQKILKSSPPLPSEEEANNEFLFLKTDYKIRRINFSEILYIEGLKDYIKVYLQHEPKPILTLSSMKAVEAKLPTSMFMRVHRSFIVNLSRVLTVERSRIVFGSTHIPVSEQYKLNFQKFLDTNFL